MKFGFPIYKKKYLSSKLAEIKANMKHKLQMSKKRKFIKALKNQVNVKKAKIERAIKKKIAPLVNKRRFRTMYRAFHALKGAYKK